MKPTLQHFRAWLIRAMWAFGYVAYVYLAAYSLMMNPRIPVVLDSTNGQATSYSCYLFAPSIQLTPPPPTIFLPMTTWANTVFYPIDVVRLAFTPKWPFSEWGTSFFWLALFAPLWFPTFAIPGRRHTRFLRRMLCLVAVAWFFVLTMMWGGYICGFCLLMYGTLARSLVVAGTLIAFAALAYSARGWRHLVSAPLWIAILAGSISVFFAY